MNKLRYMKLNYEMKNMKKIVVLIPAYNEEKNIKEVIERTKKITKNIIVIDDGSKDKTYEMAKKTKAIVLRHNKNKGKGETVRSGLKYILEKVPKIEYVIIIDADLQYLPEDSIKLVKLIEKKNLDFISGYRNFNQIPLANRLGNIIWRVIFNFLFVSKFKDTNCGIIAFNRKVMEVLKETAYGGYIIDNAIKMDIIKNKFKYGNALINVRYGKVNIKKFARMFFGNLLFIVKEGIKYRLKIK